MDFLFLRLKVFRDLTYIKIYIKNGLFFDDGAREGVKNIQKNDLNAVLIKINSID